MQDYDAERPTIKQMKLRRLLNVFIFYLFIFFIKLDHNVLYIWVLLKRHGCTEQDRTPGPLGHKN